MIFLSRAVNNIRLWISSVFPIVIVLTANFFIANHAQAYQKVEISKAEFLRWPSYCQSAGHTGARKPEGFIGRYFTGEENNLMSEVGIWHYCMGLIHVQRAERYVDSDKGKELVRRAMQDLLYTYERMPQYHPWFAEMSVTMGRAYRVRGEMDKAFEYLDLAKEINPSHIMTYSVLAMIYFDAKEYEKAAAALEQGIAVSDGGTAEVNYFLGLAYVHIGEIDKAREQEIIARERGYPLTGLARLIKKHQQ